MLFGGNPRPLCPESVRPHRCASSVSTLPLRVRSRGRASARPMGFPPPLVPHIDCEPRLPVAHRMWDWAVCRNALWVNRLWSAIYPFHSWGLDRSLPRYLLARRQERCYTAHRSPVPGGPLRCHAHRSPEGDPHVIHSYASSKSISQIVRQLRGAVCSPSLRSPKTRTPSTFRGRLMSALRPHSRPLPQAIAITTSCPLSLSFTLPGHYFGELSAPLVQKWVT
jgi:hypothetical protein